MYNINEIILQGKRVNVWEQMTQWLSDETIRFNINQCECGNISFK